MTWSDDGPTWGDSDAPGEESTTPTGSTFGAEPSDEDTSDPVIARIRQSVHALDGLSDRPLAEHADVYAAVHTQLQNELAEIDGGSAPA